ncbi:MAG: uroporphyrinogen decarboxylase family protein [Kiritimatiellota bacterium]|nr:uroporphyrinogen decarboxylase family protein [Kiritimatiellota bacterium]
MQAGRLSSRERVRLALAHRETDRIPIAMVCSGINEPTRSEFEKYVRRKGRGDLESYLDALLDIKHVAPQYIGPRLEPGSDIWGVKRKTVPYGAGSYSEIDYYPLANAESMDQLAQHTWPSADWYDYTVLPELIAAAHAGGQHCIMVSNGSIFESSWYMRGFERMFMDLAINPELAHGIMDRVAGFYVEYFRRILSAAKGEVDLVFTADDIGGQNGLLMSLDMWEQFIKPYHVRLNAAIHEHGARVIYHSDGGIMAAVAGLIDMKIDVLQALQFDAAGMDAVKMKAAYGNQLSFEGGVSVQKTLPFGTPDQVREEVEHLISTLGRNGGYILGPSHCIQAGTPPENIYAMFETARSFYPHCHR